VSRLLWPLLAVVVFAAPAGGQVTSDVPAGRPDAVVDLATAAGVSLVQGAWRYSDVSIVRVNHRGVGPDLKPSGAPAKAYDIAPHAGEAAYDDRKWQVIPPETLTARRSRGRLSFAVVQLPHARGHEVYAGHPADPCEAPAVRSPEDGVPAFDTAPQAL
jgi:hypothetical protein